VVQALNYDNEKSMHGNEVMHSMDMIVDNGRPMTNSIVWKNCDCE